MAVPACCRTARARGAVPTGRQNGRSTSANDPPAHVHRARSCRTAHPVRLAVVPSSTQFLPLNRTESVGFHRFNQRVFQQNRPITTLCVAANKLITRSPRCLFDHLVGATEQRKRNGEAERLGSPQVDDEF